MLAKNYPRLTVVQKPLPHGCFLMENLPFHAGNNGGKAGLYISVFCTLRSGSASSILHLLF